MLPLPNMITTIVILLLVRVSWTSAGSLPFPVPGTCHLSLDLLDPCFPVHPSKPTPACCEAAASLGNKITQMNLCYCLKDLQMNGILNVTPLGILLSSCHVSVNLPPVPIPEDMDCTEYVLEGDSTVGSYWALVGDPRDPSIGLHWELRVRVPTFMNSSVE
ncbi:hypothetical protein ACLB2K_002751 [Fragaria x ananassa]